VPAGWDIPLNAIVLTLVISTLLSLINIGSAVAYNQITSLGLCALISSYIVSISCVALKRWRSEPLLPGRFSLGRYGFAINVFSILFLVMVLVLCFFPTSPNPSPQDMNWAVLIYAVVMAFSLLYFHFKGRHVYRGPVEYIRKME
jgi:amino acid transporter